MNGRTDERRELAQERPERLSDVTDVLYEPITCPLRGEILSAEEKLQDRWLQFRTNNQRVCSYCGSLHYEDFISLVTLCAEAPIDVPYKSVVEIEQTTKQYKFYVHQPGVKNAMEGGIKFYTHHIPRGEARKKLVGSKDEQLLTRALNNSKRRFVVYLNSTFPGKAEHDPGKPEPGTGRVN